MEIKDYIAPMYEREELINRLAVNPEYDNSIHNASVAERLMALSDLYSLYIPTDMTVEIYYKLYVALIHSLSQKNTLTSTAQLYENQKAIKGQPYKGIIGGLDSFVITGISGVGKSSAISRAINVIAPDSVIEIKLPYQKIIPFLVVQTPFDCSLKSLLLEILRKVDELLDTKYLPNALRTRATTDVLIGKVSTVALNHIGTLILDEVQNVVSSKNGKTLVGSITQLINTSGISIVFAGTNAVIPFLQADFMLARRMMNLQYNPLNYDQKFYEVCRTIWNYQYTNNRCELTDEIVGWLYNHSQGNISVIISLTHDAQELAILNGQEVISISALELAYKQRLHPLHVYLQAQERCYSKPRKEVFSLPIDRDLNEMDEHLFFDIVTRAKVLKANVVDMLGQYVAIEEVEVP